MEKILSGEIRDKMTDETLLLSKGRMVPNEPKACSECGKENLRYNLVEVYSGETWHCSDCNSLMVKSTIDWSTKTSFPFNSPGFKKVEIKKPFWIPSS